jgi:hypothetical protein
MENFARDSHNNLKHILSLFFYLRKSVSSVSYYHLFFGTNIIL